MGFLFTEKSSVGLAMRAVCDRWNNDAGPELPEDPQQLLSRSTFSVDHSNTMWDRTRIKNKSSLAIQLIYWIFASVPSGLISPPAVYDEEQENPNIATATANSEPKIETWGDWRRYHAKSFGLFVLRYFFGTVALTVMVRGSNLRSKHTDQTFITGDLAR